MSVLDPSAWKGALLKRKDEIMFNCFEHPPTDYAGFQRYLGQYQENALILEKLEDIMKGLESDEDVSR